MNVQEFQTYMLLLAALVNSGQVIGSTIRAWFVSAGATDEQLADLDARLTSAIAAREAEHGAGV